MTTDGAPYAYAGQSSVLMLVRQPDGTCAWGSGTTTAEAEADARQAWETWKRDHPGPPPAPVEPCRVYWGSHGCAHPRGHSPDIPHECDCCDCEHHPYPDWPDESALCVAKPPYYGPETRFYGEEAEALGLSLVSDRG